MYERTATVEKYDERYYKLLSNDVFRVAREFFTRESGEGRKILKARLDSRIKTMQDKRRRESILWRYHQYLRDKAEVERLRANKIELVEGPTLGPALLPRKWKKHTAKLTVLQRAYEDGRKEKFRARPLPYTISDLVRGFRSSS